MVDHKGLFGGRRQDIKDIMYEAAEETAGIIKPIRLRNVYNERFKRDVDEGEIMKLANKLIKGQQKHAKPTIIKHSVEDRGTIYLHVGAFEEWLDISTFLLDLQSLFSDVAIKTAGRRQEVERYKLEDLLVGHQIPRGLSTEIVLDALCSADYLIRNDNGTFSMPAAKEQSEKIMIASFVRDALETKGFMPEDELVSLVTRKTKEENSGHGGPSVDEGVVQATIEDMLGDRFIQLERKVGDSTIRVIVDAQNLQRILDDAKPAVIEKLKDRMKEKIGRDEMLNKDDVVDALEDILKS